MRAATLASAIFTNRELAILIWLGMFAIWALWARDRRKSALDFVTTLFWNKLTLFFLLVIGYIFLVVWLLARVEAWTWNQLFETVFWFFGPGLVLLFRMTESRVEHPFRRYVLEAVGISVIIEFIVGLHSFTLWAELLIVPFLTVVSMTLVFAASNSEYNAAEKLLKAITVIGGLGLLGSALVAVAQQPEGVLTWDNARDFSVPLLLTFAFLPLAYLLAVGMSYETMLMRVGFRFPKSDSRYRYARRRAIRTAGLRLSTIRKLDPLLARNTFTDCTEADIDRAFEQLKPGVGDS